MLSLVVLSPFPSKRRHRSLRRATCSSAKACFPPALATSELAVEAAWWQPDPVRDYLISPPPSPQKSDLSWHAR